MKKTIATLIAGLFATAAFAQTPAPAAATTPAVVKEAKADAKAAKADAKEAKASAKHAKRKAKHHAVKKVAAKDTTVATAAPAPAVK